MLVSRLSGAAARAYSFASSWDRVRNFAERQQLHLRFRRAVRNSRPITLDTDGDVQVHLLFGHRGVHEAIGTVQSLYRFSPRPWPVVLHEDGSLTSEDRQLLESLLVGVQVIDRSAADRKVLTMLEQEGLHRCAELRRTFVLALKLFDVQLYARGKRALLLDTDILFHRPPTDLLRSLGVQPRDWVDRYNEDFNSSYAWSIDTIRRFTGVDILPSVNTGLVALQRSTIDWKRYEEWLGIPDPVTSRQHLEQTLYALEFSVRGADVLPADYDVCFRAAWRDDYDEWIETAPNGHEVYSQHYCGSFLQRRYYYRHYLQHVAPDYAR